MIFLYVAALILLGLMTWIAPSETLDAKLYYNQLDAWTFFQTLGAQDRQHYFINELCDLVFIFLYTSILYLSAERKTSWDPKLCRVVFIPTLFDLYETLSILAVLHTGEMPPATLWLGVVTCLKWLSGFGVTAAILFSSRRRASSV